MTGTTDLEVYSGGSIEPLIRPTAAGMARYGREDIDSWVDVMSDIVRLANTICETSFVPKAYRGNAPAAAAAMLAGRELGLPPMTALRHVQVVEGSPSLGAEYKRARVLSAGYRLDLDEHTVEACQVTGHRRGHKSVTVRFTIQDARRAGLVKDRGAYMTRPRRMLFARACTEVVDALFADLTNGLPTTELIEAGEEGDAPPAPDAAPAAPQRVSAEQARARRPVTVPSTAETVEVTPDAASGAETPPPPAPEAAPAAMSADPGPAPDDPEYQSAMYGAQMQFKRFVGDDRELRLALAARILRIASVATLSDLTLAELREVVDTLAKARDRAALEALLTAGEVASE